MAYTVRLHPAADQPDVLMAGMQNKKVLQFDLRTADVVQEYNYHLGAVNTVTFVDENRRFVTTSDDKTIRVWEFGIPVQVKYIADPSMHAISTTALSHSGEWGWVWQHEQLSAGSRALCLRSGVCAAASFIPRRSV